MIPYKPSDGETKTSRIIKRLRAGRRAGQRAGRRAGRRLRARGVERGGDCACWAGNGAETARGGGEWSAGATRGSTFEPARRCRHRATAARAATPRTATATERRRKAVHTPSAARARASRWERLRAAAAAGFAPGRMQAAAPRHRTASARRVGPLGRHARPLPPPPAPSLPPSLAAAHAGR